MKKSRSGSRESISRCQFDRLISLSEFVSISTIVSPAVNSPIFNPLFEERKILSPAPLLDDDNDICADADDIFTDENSGHVKDEKERGDGLLYSKYAGTGQNDICLISPSSNLSVSKSTLYQTFLNASLKDRMEFLFFQLPLLISKSNLSSLVIKLRTNLKADPFSTLPYELCSIVAKYFDLDSMLLSRCVSHRWRSILDPMKDLWTIHLQNSSGFELNSGMLFDDKHLYKHLLSDRSIRYAWFHAPPKRIDVPCHNRAVITCLQILDAKNTVASASDDGSVLLWHIQPPKILFALLGHTGGVWCIHSIGNVLLSGSTDRTLRLWNISTGACIGILKGHSSTVRCASLIFSNSIITLAVSGSRDSTLRIWDLQNMTTRFILEGHTAAVRCLAIEGNVLVSGSYDSTARIWDIETGTCIHVLIGHMAKIYSIAICNSLVATGAMDSNILLWDIKTGQCLSILEGTFFLSFLGMRGIIGSLIFLDLDHLVSSSTDGSVRIWLTKSPGECIYRLRTENAAAVSFLQANHTIIIAGADRNLRMWETRSGKYIRDLINDVDSIWRLVFDKNCCIVGCLKSGITTLSFLYFESS